MSDHRPFRFGVTAPQVASGDQWRRFVRKVEDLGFSTLTLPDHCNDQLGPMVAMGCAAEATSTLRLGPMVLANDFRHPVMVAKEIASLDLLSGGRVEWGMGAGWLPSDFVEAGIPFDDGATRASRLEESIAVMKGLFAEGPLDMRGTYYTIEDLNGTPKPIQKPHPPLVIGAAHDRMLRFAAREADIVSVAPSFASHAIFGDGRLTPAVAMDHQIDVLRAAAGDRFDTLELNAMAWPLIVTTTDDERRAKARDVGNRIAFGVDDVLATPNTLIGDVDQLCEAFEQRRERWGLSYWVVPSNAIDTMAIVVDRLAGK